MMEKRIRYAKTYGMAVAVECPYCQEAIPEPATESEMWTPEDWEREYRASRKGMVLAACPACGEQSRIPATAFGRMLPRKEGRK